MNSSGAIFAVRRDRVGRDGVTALLDREAAKKWMPVLLEQVSQACFYYIRNNNDVYSTILGEIFTLLNSLDPTEFSVVRSSVT